MERIKVCENCKKEFIAKSSLARYCSYNCRMNGYYHQKNPDARHNVLGKTDEQKRQEHNDYYRMYYRNNEKYREEHKTRRREYYRINHK